MHLTEDSLYRASSQYRLWSFTAAQLASQRQTTNHDAAARVKANVARQRAQRQKDKDKEVLNGNGEIKKNGTGVESGAATPLPGASGEKEVDCLTVEEERKLVEKVCETAVELGKFLEFPQEVTATGVQYLRRFYLTNSPMTYEPQIISRAVMFLANKTEGHHLTAERYAAKLSKTTAEQVLAPEYLIVQALRFTFDVKHPYRGLKGGHLEMMALAQGNGATIPDEAKTAKQLQAEMLKLPRKAGGAEATMTQKELERRITDSYGQSSNILKNAAILTDAYFLYTPSQIWMAAHLIADEPLTLFYLSTKLPESNETAASIKPKVLNTIRACATLLKGHKSLQPQSESDDQKKKEQAEVQQLMKKLRHCRDPDKIDLVKLNQAAKRDALESGQLNESVAKRRKIARQNAEKEADGFWGPELPKVKPA